MSFTELVLLYYHIHHMNNQYKTSVQDMKILMMFLLSVIEKFIDPLETKMTNIDPSIVGQHVWPSKNNYFKACLRIISRLSLRIRSWSQLSQFRWTSTKLIPIKKSQAGHIWSEGRTSSPTYTFLTLNPFPANPGGREKFNLNFYFHFSLWCLKRFYEGLKGITKKCENKNLS